MLQLIRSEGIPTDAFETLLSNSKVLSFGTTIFSWCNSSRLSSEKFLMIMAERVSNKREKRFSKC